MNNPFNFLDSFSANDVDKFFGRKRETQELIRRLESGRVVLVHGRSGVGKSSIVRCGLNQFLEGPDWLPLHIRRGNDINLSLWDKINETVGQFPGRSEPRSDEYDKRKIVDHIASLYELASRPVYLIFDQFEELFIFGEGDEQKIFFDILEEIISRGLDCRVLLVVREEYFVHFAEHDRDTLRLLDHRLRVLPMERSALREVVEKSFSYFNIGLPAGDVGDRMIDNIIQPFVNEKNYNAQLVHLQVYLAALYRNGYLRAETEGLLNDQRFTLKEEDLTAAGDLNRVLIDFLNEETQDILTELKSKESDIPPAAVYMILQEFVSEAGTKKPVQYEVKEGIITPTDPKFLSGVTFSGTNQKKKVVAECLDKLESRRILRKTDDYIELMHDTLAIAIIEFNPRMAELSGISKMLAENAERKSNDRVYLTQTQVATITPKIDQLRKSGLYSDKIDKYWRTSIRKTEEEQRKNKRRRWIFLGFLGLAGVVPLLILAMNKYRNQVNEKENYRKELVLARLKQGVSNVESPIPDAGYNLALEYINTFNSESKKTLNKKDELMYISEDDVSYRMAIDSMEEQVDSLSRLVITLKKLEDQATKKIKDHGGKRGNDIMLISALEYLCEIRDKLSSVRIQLKIENVRDELKFAEEYWNKRLEISRINDLHRSEGVVAFIENILEKIKTNLREVNCVS